MKRSIIICLCFFLFSIITASAQTFNPYYGQIVENTSATNILTDLNTFENLGIKEPGTTAIENTKDWIIDRYQNLGYTDIETQAFTVFGQTTSNIIVTKTGSVYPNTFVIIDGHYDTVNGPGTNDNGSGTVLILELARLLQDVDTEYSIKFIHFSGEEEGLIGSQYYVDNTVIPQNLDIKLVFNIDEVGGVAGRNNNKIVCEHDANPHPSSNNAASAAVTQELANCVGLYSNLQTKISYAYASDYMPFESNGEVITGIYEEKESSYPHTPYDILENMDPDYVYQVTQGALGAALHFAVGKQPLGVSENSWESNIIITPNPSDGDVVIHLNFTLSEPVQLTVYDSAGKQVLDRELLKEENVLDLKVIKNGLYNFVFKSGNQTVLKKVIL